MEVNEILLVVAVGIELEGIMVNDKADIERQTMRAHSYSLVAG